MTKLKLFNTLTREKEDFVPLDKKKNSLYTCGPTVYDYAHIGNFRTYIFEDVLKRTLLLLDYPVFHVMNITDVDDKTIKGAIRKKTSLEEYVEKYKRAFFEDVKRLNILPADVYPLATEYIPKMVGMIKDLIDKNIAYIGNDGSVYFSIEKFSDYGKLSHLKLNELKEGASDRIASDEYEKDTAADFVLWKHYDQSRDGEFYWDSPFGKGRPGWHIECSAMALDLIGNTIDIHCGGVDNIFPHHENEIAQSECFSEKRPFVRYWVHAEHLIVDKKKMSKSLGNFYTIRDLLEKGYTGSEIRYLLLQTHYRTQLNFTLEGLDAARASLKRVEDFIDRIDSITNEAEYDIAPLIEKTESEFSHALADDLNTSQALAVVFNVIREINALVDQKMVGKKQAQKIISMFEKIDSVLGVISFQKEIVIPQEIVEAMEKRELARREKRWQEADELRDFIYAKGYVIEDTKEGAHLKKR